MGKPKIEYGYDFSGGRIAYVSFDLNAPDIKSQISRFFGDDENADDDGADAKAEEKGEP